MYQRKVNYSPEEGAYSGPGHKTFYVQVSFTGLKCKLKDGRAYMIIGAKVITYFGVIIKTARSKEL